MAVQAQAQTAPARTASPLSRATIVLQLLGAVVFVLLMPFVFRMEWDRFQPIFTGSTLRALSLGVIATVAVSLVAILLSLPLATGLALGRLSHIKLVKWPSVAFIEVIRAVPVILLIFYINLRVPGLDVFERFRALGPSPEYWQVAVSTVISRSGVTVALALMIYTAAVNAELLRSGILSLERGQFEAARSLGLSYWQMMRLVILPQAFRLILAPLIAQFTILLKDTSLGSIIGFLELQRRARFLYEDQGNPMEMLYVVALIYFAVNYLLGLTSRFIERRRPSVEVRTSEA